MTEAKEGFHSILSTYFQRNNTKDFIILPDEPSKINLKSKLMEIKKRSTEMEELNKELENNKGEEL